MRLTAVWRNTRKTERGAVHFLAGLKVRAAPFALFWFTAIMAAGQGTETKRKVTEFPVQAKVANAEIGAEFMVRLISYGPESFVTDNYLIVEVAIYPAAGQPVDVKAHHFTLRVSGKKEALLAQPLGMVIASLKYPDWERPPTSVSAGSGDAGVSTGGPDPVERFPGDPRARRFPAPRTPMPTDGKPAEARLSAADVVNRSALPEGPRKTPVSGYLFFPWKGNPVKLKSVELVTTLGSDTPVSIRLR